MTWAQHDILGGPVEGILTTRQRDSEADTTALEREIDRLVYQLYDLTPEESPSWKNQPVRSDF